MEEQDNCIAFETVTKECNTWVVAHCNTCITWVTATQFCQAISESRFPFLEVVLQMLNAFLCPPQSTWPFVSWWGLEELARSAPRGASTSDLHRKSQQDAVDFRCSKVFWAIDVLVYL